ncbi:MAG TPA: prepilin-type N-terminal cleavage/methylation domain-containing protein [Pyrinomonadaceae bacterium]
MSKSLIGKQSEDGFSLIELIIGMTITLVVLTVATTLLAQSLNLRTRSNENVDALADAERALNIMSREIAQAGFNLDDNGIVPEDSVVDANGNSTIRIRANLNRYDTDAGADARENISLAEADSGEDVKYFIHPAGTTTLLARYDRFGPVGSESTVLANRLDSLRVHYFAQRVTYNTTDCDISAASAAEVSPAAARYIVIAVCVRQGATGAPGSPGYQPAHNLLLTSDVALRNANLENY